MFIVKAQSFANEIVVNEFELGTFYIKEEAEKFFDKFKNFNRNIKLFIEEKTVMSFFS